MCMVTITRKDVDQKKSRLFTSLFTLRPHTHQERVWRMWVRGIIRFLFLINCLSRPAAPIILERWWMQRIESEIQKSGGKVNAIQGRRRREEKERETANEKWTQVNYFRFLWEHFSSANGTTTMLDFINSLPVKLKQIPCVHGIECVRESPRFYI